MNDMEERAQSVANKILRGNKNYREIETDQFHSWEAKKKKNPPQVKIKTKKGNGSPLPGSHQVRYPAQQNMCNPRLFMCPRQLSDSWITK